MTYNARNTDVKTSKDAAKFIEESGIQESMVERVVKMVEQNPNKTARELADIYNFNDSGVISKRVSDASRKGLIIDKDVRKCQVSGRPSRTWVLP
jgi:hypothetical protein